MRRQQADWLFQRGGEAAVGIRHGRRTVVLLLLTLLAAACQNAAPPIYLTTTQQEALNTVLTRVSLEVVGQRSKGVVLDARGITEVLRKEDPVVRDILTADDWPAYDGSGRSYLAKQIYRRLLKQDERTAAGVAPPAMPGFRSPAVGGHH